MRLTDLQLKHMRLVAEAEEIRKRYPGTEAMSAEDGQQFDRLMDEADDVEKEIAREKRAQDLAKRDNAPASHPLHPTTGDDADAKATDRARTKQVFNKYLRWGIMGLTAEDMAIVKAYQLDSDTEGGYLATPPEFITELLKFVDDMVVIRQLAKVIQLPKAESLGVPTLETDLNDADWTSELATGSEDTALRLGKRELMPHPLAKRIKLSRKLIRSAAIDPEALVRDRMAYKFGVTEEKAFLTGNGAQKPLGLFTASTDGISTSRDVVTGVTADVAADGIIDVSFFLKPQYWANARWLLHRDILKRIRKLKDGDGNYLWASGLAGNRTAPTILDFPYTLSEFAPNTVSSGQYAAILGDFSYYWIVECLNMQVQVLNELYAETNQIGFIGRAELDAAPVLEEAFVRMKFS